MIKFAAPSNQSSRISHPVAGTLAGLADATAHWLTQLFLLPLAGRTRRQGNGEDLFCFGHFSIHSEIEGHSLIVANDQICVTRQIYQIARRAGGAS